MSPAHKLIIERNNHFVFAFGVDQEFSIVGRPRERLLVPICIEEAIGIAVDIVSGLVGSFVDLFIDRRIDNGGSKSSIAVPSHE